MPAAVVGEGAVTAVKVCVCVRVRHVHGTVNTYRHCGCRCRECTAAYAAYHRAWRSARSTAWVPRIGTQRRLQALAADGWSLTEIGAHANVTYNAVWNLRSRPSTNPLMLRGAAEHITRVYGELWWRTPTGRFQLLVTRHAERQGWVESYRWDGVDMDDPAAMPLPLDLPVFDVVLVEQIMAGKGPRLLSKSPEWLEALRRLSASGLTDKAVGARLGVDERNVLRLRRRHGIGSAWQVAA